MLRADLLVLSLAFSLLLPAAQVPESARTPIVVPGVSDAVDAAVGAHFYLVVRKDGTVLSWGLNNFGQLGNGQIGPRPGSEPGKTTAFVVQGTAAPLPGLTDVKRIAAGNDHALAVKSDGSVWGWGSNGDGQLALGRTGPKMTPTPVRVPGVSRAIAVSAFDNASYALLEDGTILGWGDKLWRVNGRFLSSDKPLPVPGITNAVSMMAGLPCIALLRDGSVMTWGSGFLGEGSPSQRDYGAVVVPQPAKVSGVEDAVVVASGASTAAVIRRDGSVWIWGDGDLAHLGLGKTPPGPERHDALLPVKMPNLAKAADIALGSGSAIVFEDGTLRTWGDARLGATGRPGIERIPGPTPVAGVKDLVRVWSRAYSNLGLTRDGRILAWGSVYVAP